jgi:hypothetical protein
MKKTKRTRDLVYINIKLKGLIRILYEDGLVAEESNKFVSAVMISNDL